MKKKEIVDDVTMKRAITRITYEIIERNKNLDKIVLAGIKTRGVYIAQRIQERLKQLENLDVPLIELDTKAFRDDVKAEQDTSVFPIEIDGTDVILVDDVLYTGRKSQSFQLRLPARMKEEIRRVAEMDGISINSAIVQRLAKSLREERANAQ